jgi:hypothetical protein
MDDSEGLSEFLHSTQVPIIAIAIHANWNIKIDFAIRIIRLTLSHIPRHTRSTKHDTGERIVQCIRSRHNSNTLRSANPNAVIGQKLLGLINTISELGGPLINVIQKTNREVLVDATGSDIGGMKTGS